MSNKDISYYPIDDYVQSANTLFHFMQKPEYLKSALVQKALIPRFCIEDVSYLGIIRDSFKFQEVAILEKCFCDIPFHKLAATFPVNGTGDAFDSLSADEKNKLERSNTHFAYYGEYAIAFSKHWGEHKKLQPVHYLNEESQYTQDFTSLFETIFKEENISDLYSQDVLNRLAFIKPLRGIMKRNITRADSSNISVLINKNFHDECEWRYVPDSNTLSQFKTQSIIANPYMIHVCKKINDELENEKFKDVWLQFAYDDIRYIIVPNNTARVDIINTINSLSSSCFTEATDISMQKSIMISKILVLSEIRKDW